MLYWTHLNPDITQKLGKDQQINIRIINMENKSLNRAEAAKILNVSTRTLFRLDREGIGPPSYDLKTGHGNKPLIRYDLRDLEAWLEAAKQTSVEVKG